MEKESLQQNSNKMKRQLKSFSKQRSNSANHQERPLLRSKTSKDLLCSWQKPGSPYLKSPMSPKHMPAKFFPVQLSRRLPDNPTPKYSFHPRKPNPTSEHDQTRKQVETIEREIKVEKPRLLKVRNASYAHLQERLHKLEGELRMLKTVMDHDQKDSKQDKERHSRSGSRKHSCSRKKLKDCLGKEPEQQEKATSPSHHYTNSLKKYVTQIPEKCEPRNSLQRSPSRHSITPYYIGQLLKPSPSNPVFEHVLQSLAAINFMKRIKKPEDWQVSKLVLKRSIKYRDKKTLVFDLDETLMHCSEQSAARCEIQVPVRLPSGEKCTAGVNIRPHARRVLQTLSRHFEVIVFTASHKVYANPVIDLLDPSHQFISHRLFRQHCFQTEQGIYIKDLRVLGNRHLDSVVLIDNAVYSFYFQLENGVPITPFYRNKKDTELLSLEGFLMEEVLPAKDVRHLIKSYFQMGRYLEFTNADKMIQALYG